MYPKQVGKANVATTHVHDFLFRAIPQYLMYRPANSVPYATVETDLPGVFLKYCTMDAKGRLITRTTSEVEQKCCTFQHWIHQWTHGNLLVTHLQGGLYGLWVNTHYLCICKRLYVLLSRLLLLLLLLVVAEVVLLLLF